MKAFTALVSVALAVSGALGQALTINTPASAVVCQPLLLTWSGGTPPYFLRMVTSMQSILPGNQPGAAALVDFGTVEGTTRSWLVNIPPNTQIGLNLRDSTGALAQSAPFTIQSGTDLSCLNSSSTTSTTSSSTTSGTGSTTSSTTTTSRATTTSSGTTTAPATTSASTTRSSTTSTAPATTSSAAGNGASRLSQISVAGAVGAVAAVLLA